MALSTLRLSTCEVTAHWYQLYSVLYKWKAEIIGNSTYQTMSKHKELSPRQIRCVEGGNRPTEQEIRHDTYDAGRYL